MKKLLSFTLLMGIGMSQPGEAKNPINSKWLQDLGLRNTGWLNENRLLLQADTENAKTLMRELVSEKMRLGGLQPWPTNPTQILEQMQEWIAYPELSQALSHPSEQSDLGRMVINYRSLNTVSSLPLLQEQLHLCQRMQNVTCQADMHYRLGFESSLPKEERLGHFKIGANIGLTGGHKALGWLNRLTFLQESEIDDVEDDLEDHLQTILKETRLWKLDQIEAMTLLAQAKLSWEINDDMEDASSLFEQAQERWKDKTFQAQLLYEKGRMEGSQDIGEAIISWKQALGLLNNSGSNSLRVKLLEGLSRSYLQLNADGLALPYLKDLIRLLPQESPEYYSRRIRIAIILYYQNSTEGVNIFREIEQSLKKKPIDRYWQQHKELAFRLSEIDQIQEAAALLYPLLKAESIHHTARYNILVDMPQNMSTYAIDWSFELLRSHPKSMDEAAIRVLSTVKPFQRLPELKAMLHGGDPELRAIAIHILWEMLGEKIISEIIPLADDTNKNVRKSVFHILDLARYQPPLEIIEKGMSDTDRSLQEQALKLLRFTQEGQSRLAAIASDEKHPLKLKAREIIQEIGVTETYLADQCVNAIFLDLYHERSDIRDLSLSLLVTSKYRSYWPMLVMKIIRNPTQSEHAFKLLASWNQPDAVRELRKLASHSEETVRRNYLRLFAASTMSSKDADILKPLLKQEQKPLLKLEVIGLLSKFNIPEAWATLDEILKTPEKHQAYFSLSQRVDTRLECLSPAAFITSKDWLKTNQENFLHTWFYQGNKELIWNGQQCVPFTKLSKQQQESIKQAVLELTNTPNKKLQAHAQNYLKAWSKP
jgi:tetratricopeptide (TPR) repeat protein